jgi:CHRD domain
MRRLVIVGLAGAIAAACSSDSVRTPAQPDAVSVPLRVEKHAGVAHNISVHLSGDQEPSPVPPAPSPVDSEAQGQAILQIADDNLSFGYKLIASNIENITQAHIHCGPPGMNGSIFIWLYPSVTSTSALTTADGRHDGVLAEGTVTSGGSNHVRTVAPSAVCPGGVANFAQALEKIRSGQAYVNVHTNDQVAPTNTGPGDFPGGEIRGQLGSPGDR